MTESSGRGRGHGGGDDHGGGPGHGGGHGHHHDGDCAGRDAYCVCVHCGTRIEHTPGVRCIQERCPECGRAMLREGSAHYEAYMKRRRAASAGS